MELHPGKIIGTGNRYKLIERIGLGGFSEVWEALDTHLHNKQVALKIFSPYRQMEENAANTLQDEISLTMEISHPNILIPLHFEKNDGSPFLVMPLCKGGSLKSQIDKRRSFSEEELAELVLQMGGALEYLHREGIRHQDVKPENILILREGIYKLCDFGISVKTRDSIRQSVRHTHNMSESNAGAGGTFTFFAPEKLTSRKPTPEMDIFALGVSLYEIASGDVPFEVPYLAIQSGASPAAIHGISNGLNRVIIACMKLDPTQRPSAQQLRQWAESFLHTGKWSVALEAKPPTRKLKKTLSIMALSLMAVVTGALTIRHFKRGDQTAEAVYTSSAITSKNLTPLIKVGGGKIGNIVVGPFLMEEHEVTNGQFCVFLNAEQSTVIPKIENLIGIGELGCAINFDARTKMFMVESGKEDYPVTNVTFEGAKHYAAWAGRRLPSLAEWGRAFQYNNLSSLQDIDRFAWLKANASGTLHKVKTKEVSEKGFWDLAGNVAEMVLITISQNEISGEGGHFLSNKPQSIDFGTQEKSPYVGFRCAQDDE